MEELSGSNLNKFVIVPNDPRLFAKVRSIGNPGIEVEFFLSVAKREARFVGVDEFSHTVLPRQTRVFMEVTEGHWRVGRVMDAIQKSDGFFIYDVKFPNSHSQDVHEDKLFVRCLDIFADPADILTAGCAETQFYADRRRKALRRLRDLRSATEGLTGLVSSAVELVPYQASVVRRVVQDPSLRYLLADEVGLGKTIEAGAIIRQVLIDDPRRKVSVLVPSILKKQWISELEKRFTVDDFGGAVEVLAYEDAVKIKLDDLPDLLVIDEAHSLVALPDMQNDEPLIRHVGDLAKSVSRLLLLSATPALGNADRLLGLLNLLDPSNHPFDDREGFQRKIKERQEIGRVLLPLRSGGTPLVLREQAKLAMKIFPEDKVVQKEATLIVEAGDAQDKLDDKVESLRDHIVRTYRIHHRLIRSRRIDIEDWAMRPRGPEWPDLSHVGLSSDKDLRIRDLEIAMEAWRNTAQSTSGKRRKKAVARWRNLLEFSFQGPEAMAEAVENMTDIFPGERPHLEEIIDIAARNSGPKDRYEIAHETLLEWRSIQSNPLPGRPPYKIVCFASNDGDARRLYERLQKKMGSDVDAIFDEGFAQDILALVRKFEIDVQSWVLICDKSGEEGLNLQFAHAVLHLDLPFSPARLEQRIGRLDRFGRRINKVTQRVLLPDDTEGSVWRAWFDLLANGFRIFNRSVSDVQFRVETLEDKVAETLFSSSTAGLGDITDHILEELEDERRKLDEQHALDNLAQLNEDAEALVLGIEDAEADEKEIADDIRPWLEQVLKLPMRPSHPEPGQYLRVFWDDGALLPKLPWHRLLKPGLDRPCTWQRQQAQTFKGTNLALLRPGALLIDALERIARWDDRGIAYATWRVVPNWPVMWRGFRLVWVVEPSLTIEGRIWEMSDNNELRRQAEGLLPLSTYEQLVDENGDPVEEETLHEILRKPYIETADDQGCCDYNLGSRPDAFAAAIDPVLFRDVVFRLREKCATTLKQDPDFKAKIETAVARHSRESLRSERSLEQRNLLHRSEFGADLPDLEAVREGLSKLGAAVSEPAIRLDEIGFFVIAGESP